MPTASKFPVVESTMSFLELVFNLPNTSRIRCYRGESDQPGNSKPSIMRPSVLPGAEARIFSELMSEAPAEFSNDKSMFDKLVRAQHYGLPTRLLDVSLNPLVGLYFACSQPNNHDKIGRVRIFEFHDDRAKHADSDAISLISNLSRLTDDERIQLNESYENYKKKDITLEQFRLTHASKRLIQFVRVEKPYFENTIQPIDLFKYFFVYPYKNNRRVVAQSGAFIAAGMLQYKAPYRSAGIKLRDIEIPKASMPKIVKELDQLNINSYTMFPEIEAASLYIRHKWTKP